MIRDQTWTVILTMTITLHYNRTWTMTEIQSWKQSTILILVQA